jgi:hypothetical protein
MSWDRAKRFALVVVGFSVVGLASTRITVATLRRAYKQTTPPVYAEGEGPTQYRWLQSSELMRGPLNTTWGDGSTTGPLGSCLRHSYYWSPGELAFRSSERPNGTFAWAYFRRHMTVPFVAVVDWGFNVGRPRREDHSGGGAEAHTRAAYLCLFGYGLRLGSWSVGASFYGG